MTQRCDPGLHRIPIAFGLLILLTAPVRIMAEPTRAALSGFNACVSATEARLGQQHRSQAAFLAPASSAPSSQDRLREGDLLIEQLTPSPDDHLSGALLHHWRGTAFVHGGTSSDFEQLLRNFKAYPQIFSPEVLQASAERQADGHLQALVRVRQKHVITVVMDSAYDVSFGRLDAQHRYSTSRSTRISEIESPGTGQERVLAPAEEHGFLWRQNTYWTYEERDGGLYLQVESISLSRSVPLGLGWALRPYIESVPRESLEFTLRSARNALQK